MAEGYSPAATTLLHAATYHAHRRVGEAVTVNGRTYRLPRRPLAVVCFDGCDPSYIEAARARGIIPTIERMERDGFAALAQAAMPTFTNPNNISIVCGVPPYVHGVAGNFYLDRDSGEAVMMTDATPMRAPTILGSLSHEGVTIAVVTAKDKLRKALAFGLSGIAFSAEKAGTANRDENGIDGVEALVGRPTPDQYSADLSLYVLDAGIRLLQRGSAQLLYLSLSDFIQHKFAPGTPEADAFMAAVDDRFAALIAAGADLGVVADHGMTDMTRADGSPNVVFVAEHLDRRFGEGATTVICPITDPFVRHHGALGGFVRVHLRSDQAGIADVAGVLRGLPGVERVFTRDEASRDLDTPWDHEGDLVVVGCRGVALGGRECEHDLSALAGERLRSHGSFHEQTVPFLLSRPVTAAYREKARAGLRNFDVFDFALNGVE